MAMNAYCELIDKICLETIPGYTPSRQVVVKGKYEKGAILTASIKRPITASINIKIVVGD